MRVWHVCVCEPRCWNLKQGAESFNRSAKALLQVQCAVVGLAKERRHPRQGVAAWKHEGQKLYKTKGSRQIELEDLNARDAEVHDLLDELVAAAVCIDVFVVHEARPNPKVSPCRDHGCQRIGFASHWLPLRVELEELAEHDVNSTAP